MHLNSGLLFKKYALGHFSNNQKILEIGPAFESTKVMEYRKLFERIFNINPNNKSIHGKLLKKIFNMVYLDTPNKKSYLRKLIKKTANVESSNSNKKSEYLRLIEEKVNEIDYYFADYGNFDANKTNCIKVNSENNIAVPNNSFDVVFCGNVLEHVRKPWIWIKEVARITKKNGKIILINPVSWEYHEAPIDCWRIYPEGIKALFEEAGIRCLFSKFESLDGNMIDTISIGLKK